MGMRKLVLVLFSVVGCKCRLWANCLTSPAYDTGQKK